jgi:hypothetical protein
LRVRLAQAQADAGGRARQLHFAPQIGSEAMISKHTITPSCAALVAFAAAAASQTAQAGTFQFVTMQFPNMRYSEATDINDSNQVVGYYVDQRNHKHGYVWINGTFTRVDATGARGTELSAVNASGIAVGVATAPGGVKVAFTYNIATGQQTVIGSKGRGSFFEFGIGDNGQVFGMESLRNRSDEQLIEQNGELIPFTLSGEYNATIEQINKAGELLGYYDDPANGYYYGFTYRRNRLTSFGVPGSQETLPFVFAQDGGIAGNCGTQGFYLANGNYTTYAYPGAGSTQLRGALGPTYVDGWYRASNNSTFAFIFNAGTYAKYRPRGAVSAGFGAINASGSLVGGFADKNNESIGLVGICPAGQVPCMP